MATRATRSKATANAPAPGTGTTRTRTTTATKTTVPAAKAAPTAKRTRKPLSGRENATDSDAPSISKTRMKLTGKMAKPVGTIKEVDREPITAYLRIRPRLSDEEPSSTPYLLPLSDTTVRMTDPQENQGLRSRFRPSTISPSSIYTFSHVFPPETTQSDFFTKTTLPIVHDLLQGQNGLLFTYGVTNSGKTYTVQGGTSPGSAGILPRTLDVIFNSIDGLQGDGKYRPVRLYGVEPSDTNEGDLPQLSAEPALTEVFDQLDSINEFDSDIDSTVIKLDRNYEYTVWISYAEVYNEKVYDLLESAKDESAQRPDKYVPRKSLLLTRKALPLRPSPASDNGDTEVNGKYVAGLRQFRVRNATQAKSLVKLGQLHRRVFGTLANRESSRSHGMVIIKIIRGHRGEKNDPTSLQVSRLTLVDLAGSERTKHTHTTGERLKEAGNINKSLMVLGQCMEVMRSNQRKLAASLGQEIAGTGDNIDTRDIRKTLAVIPFRHSKLTEALMDYFTGEGRVVMIVNVNPYDTGYDENSHVMKFSAIAREIYVANAPAPVHKLPSIGPGKLQGQKFKKLSPLTMSGPDINPNPSVRKVTISMNVGKKINETVLEVVEVDELSDEADDNYDEPDNPLIDALFDEVESLRMQLFEAEMRCALIEAETREEVMREMEERMRRMEEKYSRRLMTELEQNELKTDAKIDMLHKAGLFGSPVKGKHPTPSPPSDTEKDEAADVEMSLMNVDDTDSDDDIEVPSELLGDINNPPQLPAKSSKTISRPARNHNKQEVIVAGSDQEDVAMDGSEGQDDETGKIRGNDLLDLEAEASEGEEQEQEEEEEEYVDDAEDLDESDYSEEWQPPKNRSLKSNKSTKSAAPGRASKRPRVTKLEGKMNNLSIEENGSAVLLPTKSKRTKKVIYQSESEEETGHMKQSGDEEEAFVPATKKKKRQLSKKPVVTAENIERVTWEVEKKVAKTQGSRSIRRFTSGNH